MLLAYVCHVSARRAKPTGWAATGGSTYTAAGGATEWEAVGSRCLRCPPSAEHAHDRLPQSALHPVRGTTSSMVARWTHTGSLGTPPSWGEGGRCKTAGKEEFRSGRTAGLGTGARGLLCRVRAQGMRWGRRESACAG
jgi:hypothetical protein